MRYHRMHVRGWGNALSRRREKKVSNWNMEQQGEEEREKPPENSFLDLVTDHIIYLFETFLSKSISPFSFLFVVLHFFFISPFAFLFFYLYFTLIHNPCPAFDKGGFTSISILLCLLLYRLESTAQSQHCMA